MDQLTTSSSVSGQALSDFIFKHVSVIPDLTYVPLEDTDLLNDFKELDLGMTHFNDLYDTLLYSRLISRALSFNNSVKQIVDFGAGSSIPTLLAMKRLTSVRPKAIAVDIDSEALKVSQENARVLELENSYQFKQGAMQDILATDLVDSPDTLIVSNPPYIPTPAGIDDYHLLPVNGGEDGAFYIQEFLKRDYLPGTLLALFWGSLCNPSKVIPMMEKNFEILHVEAIKVHFGNYTTLPVINQHLHKLQKEGLVVFEEKVQGSSQLVMGTILKAKPHNQ